MSLFVLYWSQCKKNLTMTIIWMDLNEKKWDYADKQAIIPFVKRVQSDLNLTLHYLKQHKLYFFFFVFATFHKKRIHIKLYVSKFIFVLLIILLKNVIACTLHCIWFYATWKIFLFHNFSFKIENLIFKKNCLFQEKCLHFIFENWIERKVFIFKNDFPWTDFPFLCISRFVYQKTNKNMFWKNMISCCVHEVIVYCFSVYVDELQSYVV